MWIVPLACSSNQCTTRARSSPQGKSGTCTVGNLRVASDELRGRVGMTLVAAARGWCWLRSGLGSCQRGRWNAGG
jgi:hypothetical protein